jgi:hypothetical protein
MANMVSEIKGDKLILTIDIGQASREAAKLSKSGRTKLIATTGGFMACGDDDIKVSLNVTIPKE